MDDNSQPAPADLSGLHYVIVDYDDALVAIWEVSDVEDLDHQPGVGSITTPQHYACVGVKRVFPGPDADTSVPYIVTNPDRYVETIPRAVWLAQNILLARAAQIMTMTAHLSAFAANGEGIDYDHLQMPYLGVPIAQFDPTHQVSRAARIFGADFVPESAPRTYEYAGDAADDPENVTAEPMASGTVEFGPFADDEGDTV